MNDVLPPELDKVARTYTARLAADAAFLDAVLAARGEGRTLEEIGDAAGLTKQRIGQIIAKHAPTCRHCDAPGAHSPCPSCGMRQDDTPRPPGQYD